MLSGVCVGTNDMVAAGRFYDVVLATIGMTCVTAFANLVRQARKTIQGQMAALARPTV